MAKTDERIKEIRQQRWNRRKRRIKTISIIIGIVILVAIILNTGRILTALFWNMEIFHIRTVKVIPESAKPLLTGIVDVENLGNILFIDMDELHNRISKIREVEKCSIKKVLPSTLEIEIVIRKPWAFIERDWGGIFIDKEGKIIESPDNTSILLRVSGIETERDSVAEGEIWKLGVLQEIEKWYNFYNIQRYFKLGKIIIKKPTEIVLNETEGTRRIIITRDNIKEPFSKIQIVLEECEKSSKEWEYIDARFTNPSVKYKATVDKVKDR